MSHRRKIRDTNPVPDPSRAHRLPMRPGMGRPARLWLLAGLLATGCGGESEGVAPTVDCSQVTASSYASLTIWPLCTDCHAASKTGKAREDAPVGVNFDSYAAATAQAASAAAQVNAGLMPPRDEVQPSAEQKQALYAWAACGTPP